MKIIPHSHPYLGAAEIAAVNRVVRSGQLSMGREAASFNKEMCVRFGLKDGAVVSSGTAALHLSLLALRVGPGDEVILPSYVCTALLNAVHYVGAKPVLADVCYADANIDPLDVRRRITAKTKAILVPHMFGFPADIKSLLAFGVPLVEDCAQSLGAQIEGKFVGSLGHCGVFSFYATKMLACGEGGFVTARDTAHMSVMRDSLSYDHCADYRVRYNYKITDIQAALGRVQLKKIDKMIHIRRQWAKEYTRVLKDSALVLPQVSAGSEAVYYRYVIKTPAADAVIAAMQKCFVNAERPLFRPLHHYCDVKGYPVSERLFQESVSLPLYPSLTKAEGARIKKCILSVLRSTKKGEL